MLLESNNHSIELNQIIIPEYKEEHLLFNSESLLDEQDWFNIKCTYRTSLYENDRSRASALTLASRIKILSPECFDDLEINNNWKILSEEVSRFDTAAWQLLKQQNSLPGNKLVRGALHTFLNIYLSQLVELKFAFPLNFNKFKKHSLIYDSSFYENYTLSDMCHLKIIDDEFTERNFNLIKELELSDDTTNISSYVFCSKIISGEIKITPEVRKRLIDDLSNTKVEVMVDNNSAFGWNEYLKRLVALKFASSEIVHITDEGLIFKPFNNDIKDLPIPALRRF